MGAEIKILRKVVTRQNDNLNAIQEGIAEGILEGVKKGVSDGLKKGMKEGLKDCLSGDFNNVDEFDISDILGEILEDLARTSLRETARGITSRPAEIYVREICRRIVIEISKRQGPSLFETL